jgi:hypothetical protein
MAKKTKDPKDAYIKDLLGCMSAPDNALTERVREALRSLTLKQVQDIHALYVYCGTR